jgi:hypothetical protein
MPPNTNFSSSAILISAMMLAGCLVSEVRAAAGTETSVVKDAVRDLARHASDLVKTRKKKRSDQVEGPSINTSTRSVVGGSLLDKPTFSSDKPSRVIRPRGSLPRQ